MDKRLIDQFWRERAAHKEGRWTDPAMVEYELELLSPYATGNCRILDLGSGPAVLSRKLLGPSGSLTAVDKYREFLDSIPSDPRISKICSDVLDYEYPASYDLTLLFGVVTHLELNEEVRAYERAAARLSPRGHFVVKNQVSKTGEKRVDGFSERLKCHYVGRYPAVLDQAARLRRLFRNVVINSYPERFDTWPDTTHAAFICSGAILPETADS